MKNKKSPSFLREIKSVRQSDAGLIKRWFQCETMDLIVWIKNKRRIVEFQLCYDKPFNERAVSWKKETGLTFSRVDDGEYQSFQFKSTPILLNNDSPPKVNVIPLFKKASIKIDKFIGNFVCRKLASTKNNKSEGLR
ncbi:hypothetical protein BVX98_06020 [bacterium F11]|nr:hypothetical protein BVX98_06020 [bacterium F11]